MEGPERTIPTGTVSTTAFNMSAVSNMEERIQAKMAAMIAAEEEKMIIKEAKRRIMKAKQKEAAEKRAKATEAMLAFIDAHYDTDGPLKPRGFGFDGQTEYNWTYIRSSKKEFRQKVFDWIRINPQHSSADLYYHMRSLWRNEV
jgi:hypothetical protein